MTPSEVAFRRFFHGNFRQEVASDIISGANVAHVGMDASVKFVILAQTVLEMYKSETVGGGILDHFF